jgi:hypothetical protein
MSGAVLELVSRYFGNAILVDVVMMIMFVDNTVVIFVDMVIAAIVSSSTSIFNVVDLLSCCSVCLDPDCGPCT